MSYDNRTEIQAIGVIYLVFGIGCLIFFLGGVCALLCCCRQRFKGMERRGYVVRDAEQNAPLMVPSVQGATNPLQPPGWNAGYPPTDPPPYGTSPQAKY